MVRIIIPTRSLVRSFRFTPGEWEIIGEAAQLGGKRITTYVRELVVTQSTREVRRAQQAEDKLAS